MAYCAENGKMTQGRGITQMQALLVLNFIVPSVMVFVGVLLKKHPISDMRSGNGYNTPTARKSEAHWEYAQQIASDRFIFQGKWLFLAEVVLSALLFAVRLFVGWSVVIGSCFGFLWLCYAFYDTDKRIKERFADRG